MHKHCNSLCATYYWLLVFKLPQLQDIYFALHLLKLPSSSILPASAALPWIFALNYFHICPPFSPM